MLTIMATSPDIPAWDPQQTVFDLGGGITIERAVSSVWAVHYTAWQFADNAWFRRSWEQLLGRFSEGDPCFWIKRDGQRIGGVCLCPNEIGCLFLEPPNTEYDHILCWLKRVLLHWSDPSKAIGTYAISLAQAELYFRNGFRSIKQSRYLIRPTEPFEIAWPAQIEARPPLPGDADALHGFMQQAFVGTIDLDSPENDRSFIKFYFEQNIEGSAEHRASTVLIDRETGEMSGECLVYVWGGWPLVGNIAVRQNIRSQGLGSNMLRHALSTLHPAHPVLREFSNAGNPSGGLYHRLGFVSGPLFYEMKLPHPQATRPDLQVPKW